MNRLAALIAMALWAQSATAQSVVLTNARILDGTGGAIERGSVVVRDGRIVSVAAGTASEPGARAIDVQGKTVMPGFIDAHRHPIGNSPEWLKTEAPARMQEFLDAGFTTVLSAGDDIGAAIPLRDQIAKGAIRGPRLIVLGRVPTAGAAGPPPAAGRGTGTGQPAGRGTGEGQPAGRGAGAFGGRGDPARNVALRTPPSTAPAPIPAPQTRAQVEKLAKAGVDGIKTVIQVSPGGTETATLTLIVQEAKRHNIPVLTHAVSVADTLAAVQAGVQSLAHTPHIDQLTLDQARTIAKSGIPMMSTLGVFVPYFDATDTPLFRDRLPFPWETLPSAGNGPVNARLVAQAGTTYGYGTDTSWLPKESLALELRPLALVFSPKEIVSILTRNAAAAILKSDRGTLEAGKLADIVVLDGDPLANVSNLLEVAMVIKGGEIVVDRRQAAR